jgi:hypothetical protein
MAISILQGLVESRKTADKPDKKRVGKWVLTGYRQKKGKPENIGKYRVSVVEEGKNPQFSSVDASIALSIVQDVLDSLQVTDEELVSAIPIVRALKVRMEMLAAHAEDDTEEEEEEEEETKPAPVNVGGLVGRVKAGGK